MRRHLLIAMTAVAAAAALPASAAAAISNVLGSHTISGTSIPCPAQTDGVRVCHGSDNGTTGPDIRLKSFDGSPLEVYVILPPKPASGSDGPYPVIVQSHGWGGSAGGPGSTGYFGPTADTWAKEGFAVLQLTARGFGDSCGKAAQAAETPAQYAAVCQNGYIRLDDERYEARDVQYALGLLVDEGVVEAGHIGLTGDSYGGGVSLELATLKNRVMNADGSLSPWRSPGGTPLSITAAAPVIPWSDLAYSLVPNGRTLTYQVTSPTADLTPLGVDKESFSAGLYFEGQASGYYAPTGSNPQADLTTWFASIEQGDPPSSEDAYILDQIARYHSAYYLLDGAYGAGHEAPPPLLIANGFTDDLFSVDEALRYYNLEHALYPSDPISLFDWDGGHQRGQNKAADSALLGARINAFFDYYLMGSGSRPATGFTALTETCPKTAPSAGPYQASTWDGLHPGEVHSVFSAAQTVSSSGGDPASRTFDPITGGGACATATPGQQSSGVAIYKLPAVQGTGYTLLGSPLVLANLSATGSYPQVDAWLLDVNSGAGTETLVARGVYRLDPSHPDGVQEFQLHPGAWHFAAGHVPELELLGQDPPYARPNNEPFTITVSGLHLRLPVHERPGSAPGVESPYAYPRPGACSGPAYSQLNKRRTHAYPDELVASGTAGENPCPVSTAAARRRQGVKHVYVMVYRRAAHGRCRFLRRDGRLTRPRSCYRPIEYRASGTKHWRLRLAIRIPPGTYLVRSDAVNGYGRHQAHSAASVKRVRVRQSGARAASATAFTG